MALRQGDTACVMVLGEQALALCRELGEKVWVGLVLYELSEAARLRGDYTQALAWCEQSRGRLRAFTEVFQTMGYIARDQGDDARAQELFAEGLTRCCADFGDLPTVATYLEGLAGVAGRLGQVVRAVRLFGVADALRTRIGTPIWPVNRPEYERDLAAARVALGEEGFQTAWEGGQAMPLEQAIAHALEGDAERERDRP